MGNAPRRNGFAARHVVAAVAYLTGSWLAHPPARATETIVVHSASVVTWGEIVEAGARGLRSAPGRSTPRVAPVPVPPPEPREIGAPLISPPPGVALDALLGPRTMGTAQGLAVSTGFLALRGDPEVIPPDTNGAVGPNHLMTMLNSEVRIQDKGGGVISTVSLEDFWAPVLLGIIFDPVLLYDALSNRWIAIVSDGGPILLAVSATSDPTGSWSFYTLPGDPGYVTDFPKMGVNSTWIAITANMFPLLGGGSTPRCGPSTNPPRSRAGP